MNLQVFIQASILPYWLAQPREGWDGGRGGKNTHEDTVQSSNDVKKYPMLHYKAKETSFMDLPSIQYTSWCQKQQHYHKLSMTPLLKTYSKFVLPNWPLFNCILNGLESNMQQASILSTVHYHHCLSYDFKLEQGIQIKFKDLSTFVPILFHKVSTYNY